MNQVYALHYRYGGGPLGYLHEVAKIHGPVKFRSRRRAQARAAELNNGETGRRGRWVVEPSLLSKQIYGKGWWE